jgi:hypothetical protein
MRISVPFLALGLIVTLVIVLLIGSLIVRPPSSLIAEAGFNLVVISPNADGFEDITRFSYTLNRRANVSLILTGTDGTQHVFREDEPRVAGAYSVLFSGVVDGYTLPGEQIVGQVERRLLPDGEYEWSLIARNEGEEERVSGRLTIEAADSDLPLITTFTISPDVFTPNRDGISDRVELNVYLTKPAELTVYLVGENGEIIPISARKEGRAPGEAGRHMFDYEGGVDLGADPPPDGTYTVIVEAQDSVGQRVLREAQLTIVSGGRPYAEIVPQSVGADVAFEAQPYEERFLSRDGQPGDLIEPPASPAARTANPLTMWVGDVLVFALTVENYGAVPIRTTGPPPGTVYQQEQRASSIGALEESGAWRVALDCETAAVSYPWRWAIGTSGDLDAVEDPTTGNTYYYLPPGRRAVVWGGVRMTDLEVRNNPQDCWAGLIHEDVEISVRNNGVGRRSIELAERNDVDGG